MKNTSSNEFEKHRQFRDRKKLPSKVRQRALLEEHITELTHKDAIPYRREKRGDMRKYFEEEDVNNDWYAVFQRFGKWWFTDLDDVLRREHGPFDSSDEAHESAFRYAQHRDL